MYGLNEIFHADRPFIFQNLIEATNLLDPDETKIVLALNDLPNTWDDICEKNQSETVHCLKATDKNITDKLQTIPKGHTVLLHVGHTATDIFDYLAVHSDYPFLQEGHSSAALSASASKPILLSVQRGSDNEWTALKNENLKYFLKNKGINTRFHLWFAQRDTLTSEEKLELGVYFKTDEKLFQYCLDMLEQNINYCFLPSTIRDLMKLDNLGFWRDYFQYLKENFQQMQQSQTVTSVAIAIELHGSPQVKNLMSTYPEFMNVVPDSIKFRAAAGALIAATSTTLTFMNTSSASGSHSYADNDNFVHMQERVFTMDNTPTWLFLGLVASSLAIVLGLLYFVCNSCRPNDSARHRPRPSP